MNDGSDIPRSPFYTADHDAFRAQMRRFVENEIEPNVNDWDEAGSFPRELYSRAAQVGLLQLGYPEEYGGIPADPFFNIIGAQELARAGCGGVSAGLQSHTIGLPHIAQFGNEKLKQFVLPSVLTGEKVAALAVTEPSGGSDVARIKTSARLEGDHYIVNGQKMFITSGIRADFYTVAVRTGKPGLKGISLLMIERDTPGFSRTPLKKMGWWSSDTAALYFDDCRVPAANLIGPENEGFRAIMYNFNSERHGLAASALGFASTCLREAVSYARQRRTFGAPLISNQVIRHKLVDMAMRINSGQAYLENLSWRMMQGDQPVADFSMLKVLATTTMEFCANEAMQVLGGAGYIRGGKIERIYRECKVMSIGGGSIEVMKDLAAKQMRL